MKKIFTDKVYFIAEIGVNHNGDLNLAKKMIVSAVNAGANAVKFQTFSADTLVTPNTPKVKYQKSSTKKKETHYEMIKSLELSKQNHIILKKFCENKKIDFLSTPYDLNSAKYLNKIGCKIFKTASADIVDLELHEYLAKQNKTVLISTGMSNYIEIDQCINIYKKYSNKKFVLLHCVSNYPCSLKSLNLQVIPQLKKKYNCQVGFSDHSIGSDAAVLSYSLGARVIEKHFTINKKLKGPDQKTSVLPKEFKEIVLKVRKAKTILGEPIKKCQKEEIEMAKISRKSLTLSRNLLKGQKIQRNFLTLKRPGTGLFYKDINLLIGKRAKLDLKMNHQIKIKDIY